MLELFVGSWWIFAIIALVCGGIGYVSYRRKKQQELQAQFVVAGGITVITIIILIFNLIGILAAVLGIISFILGLIRWSVGF